MGGVLAGSEGESADVIFFWTGRSWWVIYSIFAINFGFSGFGS